MRLLRKVIALMLLLTAFAAPAGLAQEGVLALPAGLRLVEGGAFCRDTALERAVIPEGVVEIGPEAFYGCESLTAVTLPASLERIDETAFGQCPALATVYAKKYSLACEWALSRGYTVLEAETGAEITPFVDDDAVADLDCVHESDQIVLVSYTGGSSATLTVHEKRLGIWRQLYSAPANVGKNGIDKTREGDKRTPTGIFNLNTPFGILDDPGANMPYLKVTTYHYWCATPDSPYYNQLVDSRVTGRARASGDEHLIDYRPQYNYCLFIDYNAEGIPNRGSCIFLHCKGRSSYTGGCVAVDEGLMKAIIQWIEPGAKIVIREGPLLNGQAEVWIRGLVCRSAPPHP